MNDVALYNTAVTSPGHALIVSDLACRAALGNRGVAHLSVPKDVQLMQLSADRPSRGNHGARTSSAWLPPLDAPPQDQLEAAAAVLNAGSKVAILAGQGALDARAEVLQVADTLGAPVAKALLGRAVIPDDSPFSTGGIGHLGTLPLKQMMASCDTVLGARQCRGSTTIRSPGRRVACRLIAIPRVSGYGIRWRSAWSETPGRPCRR
jgi:pyruvate dehydrogenase (quinone)